MFVEFYNVVRWHTGIYTPPQDNSNEDNDFRYSARRVTSCVRFESSIL